MSQNPTSQVFQKREVTKETHPSFYPKYDPIVTSSGRIIGSPWKQTFQMPGFQPFPSAICSPWRH